jgi:hypothetical protein
MSALGVGEMVLAVRSGEVRRKKRVTAPLCARGTIWYRTGVSERRERERW